MEEKSFAKYNNPENKKDHFGNIVINNPSSTRESDALVSGKTNEGPESMELLNSHTDQVIKSLSNTVGELSGKIKSIIPWVLKFNNRRTSSDNRNGRRSSDDENINNSRRDFLKLIAATTAVGILHPEELLQNEEEALSRVREQAVERKLQRIKEKIHQEEQENIRIENATALREVLGGQYLKNGHVEINEETTRDIRYYWMKEYQREGKQHLGLMGSLERMQPWYNEIKEIFINNLPGINEQVVSELIYLAIPESHFKIGAKSKAGAKGEYQMMANTARGEGSLIIDSKVDERLDILANAKGAARTLFNYYKIAKNDKNSPKDAWDLALAKFNGGYIREYFKNGSSAQSEVKYENYLKFRQDRLNNFFGQVEKDRSITRDIRPKESLKSIAKKYGVTQDKLKVITHGESKKRAVIIPIKISENGRIDKKALDIIFDDYLSDSLENLNYPEKFYAVIKILKKERLLLSEGNDTEQIKFMTIGELKSSWAYWRKHKAKTMTLKKINKYIHPPGTEASLQKLREGNPHIKGDNIDLLSANYNNIKVYFLGNSVLDTQFREFPTIHSRQQKIIKHPKK